MSFLNVSLAGNVIALIYKIVELFEITIFMRNRIDF